MNINNTAMFILYAFGLPIHHLTERSIDDKVPLSKVIILDEVLSLKSNQYYFSQVLFLTKKLSDSDLKFAREIPVNHEIHKYHHVRHINPNRAVRHSRSNIRRRQY